MNNPLPRWWAWLFVMTVVFAAVYLAFYPGLGSSPGSLGWTSVGQFEAEQEKARVAMAPVYARYVSMPAEQLARDPRPWALATPVSEQLCAMPWQQWARQQGLSEPDRTVTGCTAARTRRSRQP